MGRTLHYYIPQRYEIDKEQWEAISKIQRDYTKNYKWTCEEPSLELLSYYPNWERFESADLARRYIDNRTKELQKQYRYELDVIEALGREDLVKIERGGYQRNRTASGFTKVASNEYNAKLILDFLLDISPIIPDAEVYLKDEGDFLLTGVIIQNEQLKVDSKAANKQLRYLDKMAHEHSELEAYFKNSYQKLKNGLETKRVIANVDPKRYEDHPEFRSLCFDISTGIEAVADSPTSAEGRVLIETVKGRKLFDEGQLLAEDLILAPLFSEAVCGQKHEEYLTPAEYLEIRARKQQKTLDAWPA